MHFSFSLACFIFRHQHNIKMVDQWFSNLPQQPPLKIHQTSNLKTKPLSELFALNWLRDTQTLMQFKMQFQFQLSFLWLLCCLTTNKYRCETTLIRLPLWCPPFAASTSYRAQRPHWLTLLHCKLEGITDICYTIKLMKFK